MGPTRRVFLGMGVAAVGGLAVGVWYVSLPWDNPLEGGPGEAAFNPYLKIGADGTITVIVPRAEMGQGVRTTLAALVAEELEVALDRITVEHGPASSAYYNGAMMAEGAPFPPYDHSFMAETVRDAFELGGRLLGFQVTGGSTSTIDAFEKMRVAGAAARVQLIRAAAERLGVAEGELRAERGEVVAPSGERIAYGELAEAAGALEAPLDVALKPESEWRLLGRSLPRVDMAAKVEGAPIFGIDVELPEMLHATVRMSPRFGREAVSLDMNGAESVPGVRRVVPIRTRFGAGFGVIAEDTWAAFRGAEAVKVEWQAADYPPDEAAQFEALSQALESGEGFEMGGRGDARAELDAAPEGEVLAAEYRVPFLAHACMEPMNATAQLKDGKLRIWTGTQAPTIVRSVCAEAAGVAPEDTEVTTTFLGGGFGRRAEADAPLYATLLARETGGRPVKVTWTREEDMTHDMYRPAALGRFRVRAPKGRPPSAVEMRVAAPPVMEAIAARTFPDVPVIGPDRPILDGAFNQPYGYANARFEGVPVDLGVPVGFWRSVGNSFNGFFHESLMDEAAQHAGLDPLEMRLSLMDAPEFAPARGALERVAEMSRWGEDGEDRAKGLAFVLSFGAWVAQVVEVSRREDGVRVERAWCAADLGRVLDPRNVEAQMISGIVFGLSSAMSQAITFENGEAVERNLDGFDALRMDRTPEIEVALLERAPRMAGAGEPGVPPVIPALGNAIFALTGERLREAPFGRAVRFV